MIKIKFIFIVILLTTQYNFALSSSIQIKVKVQDHIITNIDIEQEKKYLKFLNPKLKELENNRLNEIAKNSLITLIIKERELLKFFNFNEENKNIESIEKNFLLSKNISNKDEYLKILNSYDLDYETIRKKLIIEGLWNRYIYSKYFKNVKLEKEKLRKNLIKNFEKKERKYEYNLSEIMIPNDTTENLKITFSKIKESIDEIGFENTANIFSVSNTSKNGGLIGWINEVQITGIISETINKLKINEISKPIPITHGYLIIKLNNKKNFEEKIDIDKELEKLLNQETNRQLNGFSIILYKRLKKNIDINEY